MEKLKFKKYNSIENTYYEKTIDRIVREGHSDGTWVVEEKLHGSNFSIWYDGINLKCASREKFITESFYNHEYVINKYKQNIISLFNELKSDDVEVIIIYGELYGGNYPHKDYLEMSKEFVTVQKKRPFYNPENDLYTFDIRVGKNDDIENFTYLNVDVCNDLFERHGFFYAKPLFKGTLEECLNYNNYYDSTIPSRLGLPEIGVLGSDNGENTCEGNIIRPNESRFLSSGSRVILKNKNKKFSEKKNNSSKKPKKEITLSEDGNFLLEKVKMYITENRLKNIISHIGNVEKGDFVKLMGRLTKDVMEDFLKEYGEEFKKLDKTETKKISKIVNFDNSKMIRDNFIDIVNGNF